MIEVNLLPGGARKKATAAPSAAQVGAMLSGFTTKFNPFIIGAAVVMALALGAGAYLYFGQMSNKKTQDERLAAAEKDSANFSAAVAARIALEAKRDTLVRQVSLIRVIDGDRFIWPHILDEVSKVLPPYTWLTVVGIIGTPQASANVVATPVVVIKTTDTVGGRKPKKPPVTVAPDEVALRVTGQTVDIQAFTKFMEDLEASPFLANVRMISVTPNSDQGKEVYVFVVNMIYTRPDSTSPAVRRLPLVAAVR